MDQLASAAMTTDPVLLAVAPDQRSPAPDLRKTAISPDFWYPVARSTQVAAGRTLGVAFAGEAIVLARTASGTIFALEDRCAHRQVPLHAGLVSGETLQCGYHGWTYDSTGRCVNIPYLDKGKASPNAVRGYPCREAYGLVFVFPGERAKAAQIPVPDIPTFGNPRYRTRVLDRTVKCHYTFMHENLMDMNHQFLHRRLMGRIRTVLLAVRRGETWIEADYTFARTGGKQPIGERFVLRRRKQPSAAHGRDLMTIRTEYPYQRLWFQAAGSDEPELDLWNVYVPVDRPQRVNHTLGLMMFKKPRIPGLMHLLWPFVIWFTERIFAEDRGIVELEQQAHDAQGADWNQEIFPLIRGLREVLIRNGVPGGCG